MSEPISLEKQQELAAGYVMDELSAEESEFFARLLQEQPYLQQNIRLIQETLGALSGNVTLTAPPAGLKGKIFATIAAESATATILQADSKPSTSVKSRALWRRILAFLAALGAIALIVDNFRLRQALQFAVESQQENPEAVANIMEQGNSRLIALKGDTTTDASKGSLLFTPGKWETVVLSLQNLPPLPTDEVYRLWLTLENGTTIACGEFNTNDQKKIFVKLNPPQQVFS
jgi:anti-sigma-K factor RskA